jgi:hypothetical protein
VRGFHIGAARLVAAATLLLVMGDGATSAPNYCRRPVDEIYTLFAGAIALPGAEPRLRRRDNPIVFNAEEEAKSALLWEDTQLETALLDHMDRFLRSAGDLTGIPSVIEPKGRGRLHLIVPSTSRATLKNLAEKSDLTFFISEECYLFSPDHFDLVNAGFVGPMFLVSQNGMQEVCVDRLLLAALGVFGDLEPLAQAGFGKEADLPPGAGFVLEVLYNDRLGTNHRLEDIPVRDAVADVLRRRCGS